MDLNNISLIVFLDSNYFAKASVAHSIDNINVVDGMCNGSFCKIVGIKKNNQGNIIEIHVQFLNPSHGVETSREYPLLAAQYGFPVVPIKRMEQKLRIRGKVLGTVLQYPLKLSDSVTSHRV